MKDQVVILAAGKGTRLKSSSPKVLTEVNGKSIIIRQLENLASICAKPIIVVGFKGEEVVAATNNEYNYVWQTEQLGTGHALMCVKSEFENAAIKNIVVVPGDHPYVNPETIKKLIDTHDHSGAVVSMISLKVDNYDGDCAIFYNCGRILRDEDGKVIGIIELKDADESQKAATELNLSYYCFDAAWLWQNIGLLKNNNNSKEYYLTDIIKVAVDQQMPINSLIISNILEGMGVNDRDQLELIRKKTAESKTK